MRNIKLTIEYDGTNYNGWQIQRVRYQKTSIKHQASSIKQRTIQETIEQALARILNEKIKLIASGRTDSGTHALGQVANFKTKSRLKSTEIKNALNANLPEDIVIRDAEEVGLKFHSQYDAKSKVYRYVILNRKERSAIDKNRCLFFPYDLDFNLICKEAKNLLGRHNFQAFQASDKIERKAIRTIKAVKIMKNADFVNIEIESDGFLYKMVRNIIGTLLEIGRGRFKKGTIKSLLEIKNRKLAGPTAPARGLTLLKVNY